MLKKKQVVGIVSIALMCFLIGTTMASDGGSPWNKVWTVISELQVQVDNLNATLTSRIEDLEGQITVLQTDIETLQTQVSNLDASLAMQISRTDSLNVSYLDLLERVELLEDQMIPQGFVNAPAYDSGWLTISQDETLTLTHNLDTTELFVYVIGKDAISDAFWRACGINQIFYGTAELGGWRGLCWLNLDATTIQVYRAGNNLKWDEVRVMLWIIQEPPT